MSAFGVRMPLKFLEKSKTTDILIQLLISGHKSLSFMTLIDRTRGNISTISTRLAELESEGLITQTYEQTVYGRRTIELTPKGYKVAKKVYDIGRLMEVTVLDFTNGYMDRRFLHAVAGYPFIPEERLKELDRWQEEQAIEQKKKKP